MEEWKSGRVRTVKLQPGAASEGPCWATADQFNEASKINRDLLVRQWHFQRRLRGTAALQVA
jgi:hypothetical protein